MRKQIFIDGNKRTALIFANHFLVSNGVGVISVDSGTTDEYKKLLVEYYETNKKDAIVEFLKKSVIEL
jgi:prophage maintenance system killer protein